MSRRGNVARLPLPPEVKGTIQSAGEDVKTLHQHLTQTITILNQSLQSLQNRTNTIQQTGAKAPPTVTGFGIEGKQGLFYLHWNRIAHVDGYVVVQATDSAMSNVVGRYNIPDGDCCTHQIPVGNAAVTGSFQVYAYQGNKYSDPSNILTASTFVFGSSETAPANPAIAPRQPKIAPVRSGPNL